MPADSGVPPERKQILMGAALLEVDLSAAVDYMQMDHRMQQHGASMAPLTGSLCDHGSARLDDRQHLLRRCIAAAMSQRGGFVGRINQFYHIISCVPRKRLNN